MNKIEGNIRAKRSEKQSGNLQKELKDLIEESETRTEAYKKIIKGIEERSDIDENNREQSPHHEK